jgi:hypothetical protein
MCAVFVPDGAQVAIGTFDDAGRVDVPVGSGGDNRLLLKQRTGVYDLEGRQNGHERNRKNLTRNHVSARKIGPVNKSS